MALARLHGGPLDGQIIPLADADQDSLILPYSETQLTYRREGESTNTGAHDGPTETAFWFVEAGDDISPGDD
ncbi:response regulator [Microbacterium esteraromaticum]|uniref:Response regulator n=1 Tax=Microbacterium esteraromaticum TaxID=57043 RepID=A0A7D7WJ67_9MICO|nr:response regulator [Microbacterium esteraromaticum]QMU98493.1 response regulator [Microbacterium esteraromaticum]